MDISQTKSNLVNLFYETGPWFSLVQCIPTMFVVSPKTMQRVLMMSGSWTNHSYEPVLFGGLTSSMHCDATGMYEKEYDLLYVADSEPTRVRDERVLTHFLSIKC